MINQKQKVLEEVMKSLQKEFDSASIRSGKLGQNEKMDIDELCDFCRATGKLTGISTALDVVRDLWVSALNEDDR